MLILSVRNKLAVFFNWMWSYFNKDSSLRLIIYLIKKRNITMRIDIISVLPELMESPFQTSILRRAMDKGLAEVHFHHLRDWAINKHRQMMMNLMAVVQEW
jgi:hypothetical protein